MTETINIITNKLYFTNKIDGTNQLVIDNEGVLINDIDREERLDVNCTGSKNLQDWMVTVEDMLITLGGFMVVLVLRF
jgi:hypothetical protein